MNYEEYHKMVT